MQRPDCGFVVCTHQLELPAAVEGGAIILVRESIWEEGRIVSWDVDVINDSEKIPEWLWVDVIGARRKILFIEGNNKTSLDQPLYEALFPDVSVRPIGSCVNVIKAVDGLRVVSDVHRVAVYGLIDNDGMSEDQLSNYEQRCVYPLPIFAVESLIYSLEVQGAVAIQQATISQTSAVDMLRCASDTAIETLKRADIKEHLAARLAERKMRDKLLENIPTRDEIKKNSSTTIKVVIESPYPDELQHLTEMIDNCDIHGIVSRYSVRESGVLDCIAKGLEFKSRDLYEGAALKRIAHDADLRTVLKQKLGKLTAQLE